VGAVAGEDRVDVVEGRGGVLKMREEKVSVDVEKWEDDRER
jgi:hypothetical protein